MQPIRSIRPLSAPRMSVQPTIDPLPHWLAEVDRAGQDPTGQRIWDVYQSQEFAALWYAARDNGERFRAQALRHLFATQPQPGGRYPDPRNPAPFSQVAILTDVAAQLQLTIRRRTNTPPPVSPAAILHPDLRHLDFASSEDGLPRGPLNTGQPAGEPQAWLATYPPESGTLPMIVLYVPAPVTPQDSIHFELACMLGYVAKDYARLLGPDAPYGITLKPSSPSATAILHQFAIALLFLQQDCPPEWDCQCNEIRARFNAPPPSHPQATDTLSATDLANAAEHWRRPDQS